VSCEQELNKSCEVILLAHAATRRERGAWHTTDADGREAFSHDHAARA
jgi:hypothetical protein